MSTTVVFEELGGPDVLTLTEQLDETPGPGEVQLEVRAAGLNRAELLFFGGRYLAQPRFPSRVGVEASGIVAAVGEGVDDAAVGDAVSVFPSIDMTRYGVIGDRAIVPAWSLIPKPDFVSFTDAAAFWMAYGTAWGGLVHAGGLSATEAQTVVVSAASSSVGLAAIDLVKAHGGIVIAATRTRRKAVALLDYGADHVVVTDEDDLVDEVRRITGGRGFDIAFDPVNGPFIDLLARAAAREAVIVEYGFLSAEPAALPFHAMIGKGLSIRTFHLGFDIGEHPERFQRAKSYLLPKLASGDLRPLIDRTYPLSEARAAYERLASNRQVGKIVIAMDGNSSGIA